MDQQQPLVASRRHRLRLYLKVSLISGLAALVVLCGAIFGLALFLRSRNRAVGDLGRSLEASARAGAALFQALSRASTAIRYHACCNMHSATINSTSITALVRSKAGGYVTSSWNLSGRETRLHFFSSALAPLRECPLGHSSGREPVWKTQRLFPGREAIFYSTPDLFFVRGEDCAIRRVAFGGLKVAAVVEDTPDGWLVAYGRYMSDYSGGGVYVGIIGKDREKLSWSAQIGGDGYFVYETAAQLTRLADGTYALSYLFRPDSPPPASDPKWPAVCVAVINATARSILKKNCTTDFAHIFGLIETSSKSLLGIALDRSFGRLVVMEATSKGFHERLLLKNVTDFNLEYGAAYRIGRGKFAFAAESVLGESWETAEYYNDVYIYDYAANKVTKQRSLRIHAYYDSHPMNAELTQYADTESAVLTLSTHDGYIILPSDGEREFIRNGPAAGFWHMVAAGDGGYVVHRPDAGQHQKLWKFYPWLDGEILNCTDVL